MLFIVEGLIKLMFMIFVCLNVNPVSSYINISL